MQATDTSWKGSRVKGYFLAYGPVHLGASSVPARVTSPHASFFQLIGD